MSKSEHDRNIQAYLRANRERWYREFENPAYDDFARAFSVECAGALRELYDFRRRLITAAPMELPYAIQEFRPLNSESIAHCRNRYGTMFCFGDEGEMTAYLVDVNAQDADSLIWFDWSGGTVRNDPADVEQDTKVTLGEIVRAVARKLEANRE